MNEVSRSLGLSVSLLTLACTGPEPDFQASALTEEARRLPAGEPVPFDREADEPPDREAFRAMGLEDILSDEPPPAPFWPDEAHYPPVPADESLDAALRGSIPLLVDVLRIEAGEREGDGARETWVTAREARGEELTIVLPEHYACTAPGGVAEGRRYLLLTDHRNERGQSQLYMGIGAEHSIMPVDERGRVGTPSGMRDAAELIALARGAS